MEYNQSWKKLRREDDALGSAKFKYEYDPDEFLIHDLQPHFIYRPLPSVDTLMAVAYQPPRSLVKDDLTLSIHHHRQQPHNTVKQNIPLLNDFFRKIRKPESNTNPTDTTDTNAKVLPNVQPDNDLMPLERTSTVLTEGRHKRIKELLQTFGSTASKDAFSKLSYKDQKFRKTEWETLQTLMMEERKQYAQAWEQFQIHHVDRFLEGFYRKTNPHVSYYAGRRAEYIAQYEQRWLNCNTHPSVLYGGCVQTISLIQNVSLNLFDLDHFSAKILHRQIVGSEGSGNVPKVAVQELKDYLEEGYLHTHHVTQYLDTDTLLCEDDTAKSLATKYECDVVMTAVALESILRSQQWNLSVSCTSSGKTVFIEDPIPSISGPRECLSYGFKVGLIHHIMKYLNPDSTKRTCGEYIYSSIIFHIRNTILKVLVRSYVPIHDENEKPILLDCQPLYFSELGEEEPSGHDRGLWFLQKLLLGDCTLLCCTVDVQTSAFRYIRERGISDALQLSESIAQERNLHTLGIFEEILQNLGLEKSLQILMNLLSGVKIIERDEKHSILRYSASVGEYASVHKAISTSDQSCCIHVVRDILREAVNVFQSKEWLSKHEFRLWIWKYSRIPYSFRFSREQLKS